MIIGNTYAAEENHTEAEKHYSWALALLEKVRALLMPVLLRWWHFN